MDTTTRTTGLDLKLWRLSLGLSVGEVAAAAGCSRTYINRIEREARPSERACSLYIVAVTRARDR
ncbi:MAG TPA: helix-turn-helix transcriptional regulator [Patescibacteria group bacterium]|nr:helix-turn-helix transcriptional regulator [Patescibacteria group bacterium]